MNKVLSFNMKCLITTTALLGCLLIAGCTEVVVRISTGPGFSEDLLPETTCNLQEKSLTILGFKQENSSICWAASAQMVINHFLTAEGQNPITQCSIVDAVLNKDSANTCCGVMDQDFSCFQGGLPEDAFDKKGFTYSPAIKNPPNKENLWAKVTSQICEERPLILAENYLSGGGHSSIIYGYGIDNNGTGRRWVNIYDHINEPFLNPLTGQEDWEQVNYDDQIFFYPGNDEFDREAVYYTFDIRPN